MVVSGPAAPCSARRVPAAPLAHPAFNLRLAGRPNSDQGGGGEGLWARVQGARLPGSVRAMCCGCGAPHLCPWAPSCTGARHPHCQRGLGGAAHRAGRGGHGHLRRLGDSGRGPHPAHARHEHRLQPFLWWVRGAVGQRCARCSVAAISQASTFHPAGNQHKTAEPWLLHTYDAPFYGSQIRLVACLYIRGETSFTSLQVVHPPGGKLQQGCQRAHVVAAAPCCAIACLLLPGADRPHPRGRARGARCARPPQHAGLQGAPVACIVKALESGPVCCESLGHLSTMYVQPYTPPSAPTGLELWSSIVAQQTPSTKQHDCRTVRPRVPPLVSPPLRSPSLSLPLPPSCFASLVRHPHAPPCTQQHPAS